MLFEQNVASNVTKKLGILNMQKHTKRGEYYKKHIKKTNDEIIDTMPVEMRTARWIVREQESFMNQAKIESKALLDDAKAESEKLIANSYVIQEAVIEANALIKQAEVEMQTYRTNIEDTIDQRIDDIQNKIDQLSNFLENEKNKLREPRNIENPEN